MILDRQLGKPLIIWYSMEGYTNKKEKKKKEKENLVVSKFENKC